MSLESPLNCFTGQTFGASSYKLLRTFSCNIGPFCFPFGDALRVIVHLGKKKQNMCASLDDVLRYCLEIANCVIILFVWNSYRIVTVLDWHFCVPKLFSYSIKKTFALGWLMSQNLGSTVHKKLLDHNIFVKRKKKKHIFFILLFCLFLLIWQL